MSQIKVIAAQTHTPEYLLHKYWARKPHNILSSFIQKLVPDGGVVVDPFCGSGVTLREAQKLGKTAYGFDINPTACLISKVLIDPPETDEFVWVVSKTLEDISEYISESYSENGRVIKYCVHSIIAKCPKCECIQKQSEAVPKGKSLYCKECGSKLRLNLEYLTDTEIQSVYYVDSKDKIENNEVLLSQTKKSKTPLFQAETKDHVFSFAENRRILAFGGMNTSHLFTVRNFSILCYLSDVFSRIEKETIRNAALLLLSASVAQCSRLIAFRNNLSTGGPAWSVPGFWVPAVHLETNPLVHLKARLKKFSRGLAALNNQQATGIASVQRIDARQGLELLFQNGVFADLIFFDPPYGDNVPYVEFSSMWNSFLDTFPSPDDDISVSDRMPRSIAWKKYEEDILSSVSAIRDTLKPDGKLLITFNNNDMRAWYALLSALQQNQMQCEFVTYQIPAVVSSKAQMSIESSYVSDIYSIYKKSDNYHKCTSLNSVTQSLINCAEYRGGVISKALALRTMMISWLKNNISVELLSESDSIINSIFEEVDGKLLLKNYRTEEISPFTETARRIAKEQLSFGPIEWRLLYESVASEIAEYGIPDPQELRAALDGYVTFDGTKCIAYIEPFSTKSVQLTLFDFIH